MNARAAAARALAAVLAGKASLGGSLPAQLKAVAPRDQGLVQELAFGTARWYNRLEGLARELLNKPMKPTDQDLHALLLVGLYQLLYLRIPAHAAIAETVNAAVSLDKPWAKGLLNAVLRRVQREGEALLAAVDKSPSQRCAHPGWLYKRLQRAWPDQLDAITSANNLHPPMTLRVNQRRLSRDAYLQQLADAGIDASACPFSAVGIQLATPCDVNLLPGFADGLVSVQDEAAQLAAPLLDLKPGLRVLDACCAPGGKTCQILEQQPDLSEVVALDLEPARLKRVEENLDRLRLNATLIAADGRAVDQWWDGTPFQRILLDAPCSATGVIRRHPDIKLTRTSADIAPLAALQGELLDALWPTLEVGGILVYATCSVLPDENTRVIEAFLAREPGARLLDIGGDYGVAQPCGRQLLPQADGHDGFYLARLIKLSASPQQKNRESAA
ncbi:MAG: 16S rRNA (cytosine(967)-C(5))-methyltransferase [Pseudomonadales bacterium]|uniref:16S rRNA (cytosine(967)-C(5))-methyltransferase RsmB n=1 Tax=Halopseudomonas aestusnigri TaxID=857252 RepID=UPI000C8F738F|nr:16S rRNA (cytosine(967)-C(5))-methyltransferase [Pseudomonadales bacterium]MAP75532.1 16S rRNA (cytosine(967)-C(5))-methyltransferase [Pseudomonadales bacterium]MAS66052.1 16S rRNA (cytosine(967)-C(5))-methyltransferase [Pseudomonadales bacterium]HCP02441.1 16S rRNA (cytosine(967)-C(5))-methyltransferase [Pseudomonas sp.]